MPSRGQPERPHRVELPDGPAAAPDAATVEREAASRRVSALAELGARLSNAVTREQVVAAIVAGGEELAGAARAAFVAVHDGCLRLAQEEGLASVLVELVEQVGVPEESPIAVAARTGEMVLLATPEEIEERYPNAALLAEATGLRALANLPIWLDGRVVGALHLGFDSDHAFTADERTYLLALSRLCAQALERADIFDWQARITLLLSEAQTSGEVVEVAQSEARGLFGSDNGALYLADPIDGDLVLGRRPDGHATDGRLLASRPSAMRDAFWSGQPVVIADQADYLARYPEMAADFGIENVPQASLTVPLRFRGNILGALGFGFSSKRQVSQRDVTLAQGLADAAAAALERVRLQEVERRAVARQAAIAQIARFALDATDPAALAEKVIEELRLTEGAAAATVYLLDTQAAELVRLATGGWSDATRVQFTRIFASAPLAATEALRTGRPVYVTNAAEYGERWPGTLDAFRAEGFEAFACLQLAVPGRTIGTITVGFPQGRLFGSDERAFLETIAATSAQGLERLRLGQAERLAVARQAAVAQIARFGLEATEQAALAQNVIEEIAGVEDADSVAIYLLDAEADELVLLAVSGWSQAAAARFGRVSLSFASAATDAVRTGRSVYVEDAEEYVRRWPGMRDRYRTETLEASAVLRLAVPGHTTGIVSIGMRSRHVFDPDEKTFLDTIAATAAQGLERVRAQDAERQARKLLESAVAQMPVGVRILAPNGAVMASNPLAVAPWRGDREIHSVADYAEWPVFHSDGRPWAIEDRPSIRALRDGEVVVDEEMTIERFDGTSGVLAVSAAPVLDDAGEIIAGVVVSTDITERKEQERSREAFLALLSHELRTPMTSIAAAIRILQNRGQTLDATTVSELYGDIAAETDRLKRMVENLLVLSRVERDMVQSGGEPVLLGRLLPPRVRAEQALWPETTFRLRCAERLPIVDGDPGFIEHILRNLLSNAAKYAPGEVEVDVESSAGGEVTIAVRDHGSGVSPDESQHLFELFWRSPVLGRKAPGAGVGLFVVRKLAEAMGGRVWLDQSVRDGARFVVALRVMDETT